MAPQVILYAYPESPFGQKLSLVLLFKQIPFSQVLVPRIPPRSALIDPLGITYRRIPVLAIGNDLYLDTSLAVLALERAFPEHSLAGKTWGLQTASAFFWSDRAIFRLAASLLPWGLMTANFIKDRSEYSGVPTIDVKALQKNRPAALSALRSHMSIIESQLATTTTPFLLSTPTPTYLDLSLFFSLNWVSLFPTTPPTLFDSYPLLKTWLSSIRSAISLAKRSHPSLDASGKPTLLAASDAAALIHRSVPNEVEAKKNDEEPLLVARGGWLEVGGEVEVTPDDTGKVPQRGVLVALNAEQVVLEVRGEGGVCRVHAPRLGFTIKAV